MSAELIELSNALAQSTEHAARSTASVHTEWRGSSSGVVWRPGVVVTADHALRRDEEIHLTLPDGRVVAATLAGRDPSTDIAVLKCAEAATAVSEFREVPSLKPGSLALVVGRTRGGGPVAGLAVVSLIVAERQTWAGASLAPYVRLDIVLQPTATGGTVFDAHGRTVGMATPRFPRFGAIAIPAPTVNRVVDILLEKGRIPRGYLGVGLQSVRLSDYLRRANSGLKWHMITPSKIFISLNTGYIYQFVSQNYIPGERCQDYVSNACHYHHSIICLPRLKPVSAEGGGCVHNFRVGP